VSDQKLMVTDEVVTSEVFEAFARGRRRVGLRFGGCEFKIIHGSLTSAIAGLGNALAGHMLYASLELYSQ
jgi:hypothetical protein